jgi:hypothetical protein
MLRHALQLVRIFALIRPNATGVVHYFPGPLGKWNRVEDIVIDEYDQHAAILERLVEIDLACAGPFKLARQLGGIRLDYANAFAKSAGQRSGH